jgi:hypothetical protein
MFNFHGFRVVGFFGFYTCGSILLVFVFLFSLFFNFTIIPIYLAVGNRVTADAGMIFPTFGSPFLYLNFFNMDFCL